MAKSRSYFEPSAEPEASSSPAAAEGAELRIGGVIIEGLDVFAIHPWQWHVAVARPPE